MDITFRSNASRMAGKSRWERVSRIKVIEPAHLTKARITYPLFQTFPSHPRRPQKRRALVTSENGLSTGFCFLPSVTRAHALLETRARLETWERVSPDTVLPLSMSGSFTFWHPYYADTIRLTYIRLDYPLIKPVRNNSKSSIF